MLVHGVLPRCVGDVLLSNVAKNNLLRFLETDVGSILIPGILDIVAETVSRLSLCLVEFLLFHTVYYFELLKKSSVVSPTLD